MSKNVLSIIFILFSFPLLAQNSQKTEFSGFSWEETQKKKQGIITVLHYDRRPFVYLGEMGQLTGIEHDVISELARYIQSKYDIQIFPQWKKYDNYEAFHKAMQGNIHAGIIGLSSMRLDKENTKGVKLSPPFMKGMEILVSSKNIPTAQSQGQIKALLNGKIAVTLRDSPLEEAIKSIQKEYFPESPIKYVNTQEEISDLIGSNPDMFGYIPLPEYYTQLKQGKEITRQTYFEIPHQGYALTFPENTDWDAIVKEFMESEGFKGTMNFVIKRHLGTDATDMLWEEKKVDISQEEFTEELDPASLKVALDESEAQRYILKIIALVCVVLMFGVVFFWFRNSRKSLKLISERTQEFLKAEEELKITSEKLEKATQFGVYTQQAALRHQARFENLFEESFILFKPREELSGDFYWFEKVDNLHILVVLDSTGQMFSAGFIHVQVNYLLDRIIKDSHITEPAQILMELDKKLVEINYEGADFIHKDGLTVSVAIIDEVAKKVSFAGAKQPIYYVKDRKFNQFKGKKFAVGGAGFKAEEIEQESFEYSAGDMIYLCTDGFQDQLSSDQSRYMVKRFREFLFEIHDKALASQAIALENEINRWKGSQKQTDDILIIGIKMA